MSAYDEGYAAGWDAFGNKTVDGVEALLQKRSPSWTAGFMAGWYARRELAVHYYGTDVLRTKLLPE